MTTRFKPGDVVRVHAEHPTGHVGHMRTPFFLRGKRGRVLRLMGRYANPEDLAYGGKGLPKRPLYWVQFAMGDVWEGKGKYGPADTLAVEIYEHWLEPDTAAATTVTTAAPPAAKRRRA